ncbi:uncharacterized protein [Procambarus clarkii]|uniref:uncharacterized protein n=1 Tax=Procambarus clarkii TaxID=6728 RepID=UPI003742BB67
MSSEAVKRMLSAILIDVAKERDEWTEENRRAILQEYMQIFDEVWSEAMDIFQDPDEIRIRESVRRAVRDGRPSRGETRETIEDVEIRHEGTLIAVTKKRKKVPSRFSALLGKAVRLQSNAAEKLNVDLPPTALLETTDSTQMEEFDEIFKNAYRIVYETTRVMRPHIQCLTNIVNATETVINNDNHPVETLITNIDKMNVKKH